MKVTIKVTEICEKFVDLDLDNVNDMNSAYEAVESLFNDMLSNGEIDLTRPDNYSCDFELLDN